jgi:hypothetical protein
VRWRAVNSLRAGLELDLDGRLRLPTERGEEDGVERGCGDGDRSIEGLPDDRCSNPSEAMSSMKEGKAIAIKGFGLEERKGNGIGNGGRGKGAASDLGESPSKGGPSIKDGLTP